MKTRETFAEINLNNLAHNYNYFKDLSQKEVFGVVKANAYGHGDIEISRKLEALGTKVLCVSSLDEALRLKENGIMTDILIFSYVNPKYVRKYNDKQFIFSAVSLDWFNEVKMIENLRLHIKVNAGMNRIGMKNLNEIKYILETKKDIEGIYAHFSSSDEASEYLDKELNFFNDILADLDYDFKYIHMANTHGVRKLNMFNAIRLGIGLYGYEKDNPDLRQVMSLKTKVIHLNEINKDETVGYNHTYTASKNEIIASLPIGYADGVSLKTRTVVINNKFYPVVGKICMDQMMVLVDEDIKFNDDVYLVNELKNYDLIWEETDVFPYLTMTSISNRVNREYID